jgi:hypothetical protein
MSDAMNDIIVSAEEEQEKFDRAALFSATSIHQTKQENQLDPDLAALGIVDTPIEQLSKEERSVPVRYKTVHEIVDEHVRLVTTRAQLGIAIATLSVPILAENTFNAVIDGLRVSDMAARAGRGMGFNIDSDFFHLHLFNHIYSTIYQGAMAASPEPVDTIPKMVLAGAAQMIPEALGASVSGMAATKLAGAIYGKLNRVSSALAHWAGVTFYGGAAGAAESGTLEGGLHGAQSWGVLDACLAPVRGRSKILQSLVGGPLLATYTALMSDEDADPDDTWRQIFAAGILGTIFPWFSRRKTPKFLEDMRGLIQPIQNWMAKEARLGIRLKPGSYVEQFYDAILVDYERAAIVPRSIFRISSRIEQGRLSQGPDRSLKLGLQKP